MTNLSFIELNEKEFNKLENNFNNSNFYQTVNWGYLKELTNWHKSFIGVFDGKDFKAITLLLYKNVIGNKKIFYAPRGILTDYKDFEVLNYFTTEIKKYIRKRNGFIFKMDPLVKYCNRDTFANIVGTNNNIEIVNYLKNLGYIHKGFTIDYSNEIQYRWSFYLDITKPENDLIKSMNNRCKRSIKKGENYPLIIKEVNENNIIDFKNIMEHTCNRHKCFDRSIEYYKKIKTVFKDKAKLLIVYLDKKVYLQKFKNDKLYKEIKKEKENYIPLSAGVFIMDNQAMHYVYGGTYKNYMHFESQYILQLFMIKYAKENNLPTYDFGGISGNFNKNSSNYGIYDFKRGFGGYVVEYIGEFDLITNSFIYFLYKTSFKLYNIYKKLALKIIKHC